MSDKNDPSKPGPYIPEATSAPRAGGNLPKRPERPPTLEVRGGVVIGLNQSITSSRHKG